MRSPGTNVEVGETHTDSVVIASDNFPSLRKESRLKLDEKVIICSSRQNKFHEPHRTGSISKITETCSSNETFARATHSVSIASVNEIRIRVSKYKKGKKWKLEREREPH
jgi:hypothetical protein